MRIKIKITKIEKNSSEWVKIAQDVYDNDDFERLVSSIYEHLDFLTAKRGTQ